MGNCFSDKRGNQEEDSLPNLSTEDTRKHVYILYNGKDKLQEKNAKSFRDALRGGEGGKNMKIKFTDVSTGQFDGLAWLKQIKHVLVLCVNEGDTERLKQVVSRTEIAHGGLEQTMHAKVLSVSFGTTPPQDIMPDVLRRTGTDMTRDFCFGFEDLNNVETNHFDRSTEMQKLRTIIISELED